MKIIHDIQTLQSPGTRERGIGKYTSGMVNAVDELNSGKNIHMLNSAMKIFGNNALRSIKKPSFKSFSSVKNFNIPVSHQLKTDADELLREVFINSQNPDIVHIYNYFDGFNAYFASSIKKAYNIPTAITLHDIIPYNRPELYLKDPKFASWYRSKLFQLTRADAILCNSEYTKKTYLDLFGKTDQIVENVSTDTGMDCNSEAVDSDKWQKYAEEKAIKDGFIFTVSGDDPRKNNDKLVEAFGEAVNKYKLNNQLVIACKFGDNSRQRLTNLAISKKIRHNQLIILDYISDEDLIMLYKQAEAFIFASLEEGFGMPVLEAMRCGCPVIASNSSSLIEVVGNKEFLFDPEDTDDIAEKIDLILNNQNFRNTALENSKKQEKLFSWKNSAQKTLDIYKQILDKKQPSQQTYNSTQKLKNNTQKKIAWVSPIAPDRSGIADYSMDLLASLNKQFNVELFSGAIQKSGEYDCNVSDISELPERYKEFDYVIYNIGNSDYHTSYLDYVKNYPGVVILHDFNLLGLMCCIAIDKKEHIHLREFYKNAKSFDHIKQLCEDETHSILKQYPLSKWVFDSSLGVLVHSNYLKELAEEEYKISGDKISVISQPIKLQNHIADAKNNDEINISSFGDIVDGKCIPEILQALQQLKPDGKKVNFRLVGKFGDPAFEEKILKQINKIDNKNINIYLTGRLSNEDYIQTLKETDIAIQLRGKSRGETSRALLECMSYGIPTISHIGYGQEFKDEKVIYNLSEINEKTILKALNDLTSNFDLRKETSQNSFNYIKENHSPELVTNNISEHLQTFYANNKSASKNYKEYAIITNKISNINNESLKACFANAFDENLNSANQNNKPTIYIDVSVLEEKDFKSGIQRVVKSFVKNLINKQDINYQLVCRKDGAYFTAQNAYNNIFDFKAFPIPQTIIEPKENDIFFALDLDPWITGANLDWLKYYRQKGLKLITLVYDTLPLQNSKWFTPEGVNNYAYWFSSMMRISDHICAISKTVADNVKYFVDHFSLQEKVPEVFVLKMGADAMPIESRNLKRNIKAGKDKKFVMLSTIEPRKGYDFILNSFRDFWNNGSNHQLTIVGKKGWADEALINLLEDSKVRYPDKFKWLDKLDDNELLEVLTKSDALIANSEDEGFGLPLIEAAYLGLPVIARNNKIFKEVTENFGMLFQAGSRDSLEKTVNGKLKPITNPDEYLVTWQQASEHLHQYLSDISVKEEGIWKI